MIRMIVTDIDGTLLPEAMPVPPAEVTRVIGRLLDLGVRVVLASGRPYSSLRNLFPCARNDLLHGLRRHFRRQCAEESAVYPCRH